MASRRDEQKEDAVLRVMRLISRNPKMSSRKIAEQIGISNGSAYYVLSALMNKGFVKLDNFKNNPRKGEYAYLLTPKGIKEKAVLTYRFIERKRKEFENLKAEINSLEEEAGLKEKKSISKHKSKTCRHDS